MIVGICAGTYLFIAVLVFFAARKVKPPGTEIRFKWLALSSLLWGRHFFVVLKRGIK